MVTPIQLDVVLIAHNHYDHFDIAKLRSAHRPRFIALLENDANRVV